MPIRKVPIARVCVRCADAFETRSLTSCVCEPCRSGAKQAGPACLCGCGEKVAWQPGKGWGEYRQGHLLRARKPPNAKELDPNWRPWNYGLDARENYVCAACGKKFKARHKAKYCGMACRDATLRRESKTQVSSADGLIYRFVRNDNDRWVQEHRLVMERHLGRKLLKREVVHHINPEATLDNSIGNLHVFHCNGCHISHHKKQRPLEYMYPDLHDSAFAEAKAKRAAKRACVLCKKLFKATIGNQARCLDCMRDEKALAPLCRCGCGAQTKWSSSRGYSQFVLGHHARLEKYKRKPNQIGK